MNSWTDLPQILIEALGKTWFTLKGKLQEKQDSQTSIFSNLKETK